MDQIRDHSTAPDARLGWGERLAYGAGSVGANMPFTIVSSMLTIYLTNVAHLNIAVASSIIAVSALLDGISDLIAGNIIDRTASRLGKARPWLLRMALPIVLSVFLLFRVPEGIPETARFVYLFFLYNLCITCFYTLGGIAEGSMVSLLSSNGEEQALLGTIRAIGETVGMTLVSVFFVKLLPVFSNDPENLETQSAFSGTLAVFCCAALALMLIAGFFTRERVRATGRENRDAEKTGFLKTAKVLLRSKYWVILLLFGIVGTINLQLNMATCAYFSTYVLGDLSKMSLLMTSIQIAGFLALLTVPALMGRFGKRKLYIAGLILSAAGYACVGLFASTLSTIVVFCILLGCGRGLIMGLEPGMVADAIRLTGYRTGVLSAGVGNSGMIAARKLGMAIASALTGLVMSLAGFSAANEAQNLPQPAAVSTAVTWLYAYGPAVLCVVLLAVFIPFFHLEKELSELE